MLFIVQQLLQWRILRTHWRLNDQPMCSDSENVGNKGSMVILKRTNHKAPSPCCFMCSYIWDLHFQYRPHQCKIKPCNITRVCRGLRLIRKSDCLLLLSVQSADNCLVNSPETTNRNQNSPHTKIQTPSPKNGFQVMLRSQLCSESYKQKKSNIPTARGRRLPSFKRQTSCLSDRQMEEQWDRWGRSICLSVSSCSWNPTLMEADGYFYPERALPGCPWQQGGPEANWGSRLPQVKVPLPEPYISPCTQNWKKDLLTHRGKDYVTDTLF